MFPNTNADGRAPDATEPAWRGRSLRDLIAAAAVVAGGGLLFLSIDAVERLSFAALRFEAAELDDLMLTLCLAVAMAGWFSYRRWRDSSLQIVAFRSSAAERAYHLGRLEELSAQLLEAEERERNRVAEVLHDEIGQTLYACRLKLDLLASGVREDAALALLAQAQELTAAAMTRARDLSVQLSPPALHDLGIAEAIEGLLPRLQQRFGLRMQLMPGAAWERIPSRFHGPVYHSVSELVVNAAKHAGACQVALSAELDPDGGVRIKVADDGEGFDRHARRSAGFGLFSIERRMELMNGKLEITSSPGRGTTATLHLIGSA